MLECMSLNNLFFSQTEPPPPPYKFMDLALKLHPPLRKGKGPTIRNYPWGGVWIEKGEGRQKLRKVLRGAVENFERSYGGHQKLSNLWYISLFFFFMCHSQECDRLYSIP